VVSGYMTTTQIRFVLVVEDHHASAASGRDQRSVDEAIYRLFVKLRGAHAKPVRRAVGPDPVAQDGPEGAPVRYRVQSVHHGVVLAAGRPPCRQGETPLSVGGPCFCCSHEVVSGTRTSWRPRTCLLLSLCGPVLGALAKAFLGAFSLWNYSCKMTSATATPRPPSMLAPMIGKKDGVAPGVSKPIVVFPGLPYHRPSADGCRENFPNCS
jgi:hypothetical protein